MKSISEAKWKVQVKKGAMSRNWYWEITTTDDIGEEKCYTIDMKHYYVSKESKTYRKKGDAHKKLKEYLRINKITNYEVVV